MTLLADMGLPMIEVIWPPAWIALIPVIFIEAEIGRRIMRASFRRTVCASTAANVFSTVLGIPLTWIALAVVEMLGFSADKGLDTPGKAIYSVTVQSPWLMPNGENLVWMVPAAVAVLCIPLWLMSAASEYMIVRQFFPKENRSLVWRWMLIGNAASYAFLLLLLLLIAIPFVWTCVRWVYDALSPATDFVIDAVSNVLRVLCGSPGSP
jgi:hypothetical protein